MKEKPFQSVAALCAAGIAALATNAQMAGAELAPQFRWKPIPVPKWKTQGGAKIENGVLTVSRPEPGTAYAEAELDLSEYDGKAFELAAVFEGKGVGGKTVPYGGFTLCVSYLDVNMGGNRTWPMCPKPTGDFGPTEVVFTDRSEKVRGKPVVDFRREHGGARILVGEFSAIAWAEGADQYLRDSISVFEELGFDWTYHEFGGWGWKGWNVEVDVEGRGKEAKYTKSEGNPRKRALLDGLARWKLDNAPEGK